MNQKSHGFSCVRALPELTGKKWDEVTESYMRALRPSCVRVVPDKGVVTSDAKLWRVTVYLTASGSVQLIEQEVEVDLPDGVRDGYDLRCRMRSL